RPGLHPDARPRRPRRLRHGCPAGLALPLPVHQPRRRLAPARGPQEHERHVRERPSRGARPAHAGGPYPAGTRGTGGRARLTLGEAWLLTFTAAAPPFMKNAWLVACPRTRKAVLIDPGDEVDEMLATVARERLAVEHILLTHAHLDHVTGVRRAVGALNAPVWLHPDDLPLYDAVVQQGLMF